MNRLVALIGILLTAICCWTASSVRALPGSEPEADTSAAAGGQLNSGGKSTDSSDGQTPFIVLDPGTHTGPIRRIAVDASETVLATASDDKSARLWDLASGRLLATLHPPVGHDQIGRLYGAAISRAGLVALAGTTAETTGHHRIYVFDLKSYAYLRSFDARGGNIRNLHWSSDGKLLAAVYADSPAVRVFDEDGALVFEETLSGDAYYVAYSPAQRIAVSATDGSVHLYSITNGRIVPDGSIKTSLKDPRGIEFSPDGSLLAVGYLSRQSNASVRVDVFDVASRSLARSFVYSDISQGNLMNVAWQSDGRALYSGGTGYDGKNSFVIKRISWPEGKASNIYIGSNSTLDLKALSDGRLVFATAEPTWGVLDGDRVVNVISGGTAQFYDAATLGVNSDASEVSWSYRVGEPPVHFSLADRHVREGAGNAKYSPETSTWRLNVSDWENHFNPKINGKPIKLAPTEVARASAVLPDNAGVILGSSRSLRRFDPDGRERWELPLPTEARAVNVSRDGKVLVVAMLDGTIRWRRTDDGALLMSLFTTRDRLWVLWTEIGYFDTSAGAENLIGWLINRSNGEQADYYPISRFREKYFRPDVLDRVLRSSDAAAALASANRDRQNRASNDELLRQRVEALIAPQPVQVILPPTVTLHSPAIIEASDKTVSVDYSLFSPFQSPVTSFSIRVDGRPYDSFINRLPDTLSGGSVGRVTLTLPERDSQVQLFAGNASGISVPATLSVHWHAPQVSPPAPVIDNRPRLYLLSVGVSRYHNSNYNLPLAAKDAADFTQTLLKQNGGFYRQVDVKMLSDERATRAGVLEGLKWLRGITAPNDVGMLYLAGHGLNDTDNTYYFLPHDVDLNRLSATSISEEELRDALTSIKGKSIFFVDTCYSGNAVGVFSNMDLTRISNKFSSPEFGIIVFSASGGRQESLESLDWGNGAFTKALVEGLIGRADYRKEGVVTYKGLDYFVSDEVKRLTSGLQTPVTTVPVGLADFALAKVLNDQK